MEFWEGAILVVGGLFLVGHMSRKNANHPINSIPIAMGGTGRGLNPTTATNLAGSDSLVVGEPFSPGGVPTASSGAAASGSCCGKSGGLPTIVTGGGAAPTPKPGASTGAPRGGIWTLPSKFGYAPVPIRQVPVQQQPTKMTALSPAAAAPKQPVRFYAV